jgi:hypothetical protein
MHNFGRDTLLRVRCGLGSDESSLILNNPHGQAGACPYRSYVQLVDKP